MYQVACISGGVVPVLYASAIAVLRVHGLVLGQLHAPRRGRWHLSGHASGCWAPPERPLLPPSTFGISSLAFNLTSGIQRLFQAKVVLL